MLGGLGLVRQNVSASFHVLRRQCVQIKKETNKVTPVIEILKKKKTCHGESRPPYFDSAANRKAARRKTNYEAKSVNRIGFAPRLLSCLSQWLDRWQVMMSEANPASALLRHLQRSRWQTVFCERTSSRRAHAVSVT